MLTSVFLTDVRSVVASPPALPGNGDILAHKYAGAPIILLRSARAWTFWVCWSHIASLKSV